MRLRKLEEIKDLRSVWATEAGHFIPWLAKDENIAELGDKRSSKSMNAIKSPRAISIPLFLDAPAPILLLF